MNFIDIEASGLHPNSFPIEIAVLDHHKGLHQWLIQPLPHWTYWDQRAEALHGITREQLNKEGEPATVVATALNDLLVGQVVYCDSVRWDSHWIKILFRGVCMTAKFEIYPIQDLMTPNRIRRFELIKEDLERNEKVLHRAASDVRQMASIARRLVGGDVETPDGDKS